MPSDPRVPRTLAMLAPPLAGFRAAVTATLEEIRGYLSAGRSQADTRAARLRDQLGPFAGGRIDTSRLAALLGDDGTLDAASIARLDRVSRVLHDVARDGDDLFTVDVPPGAGLAGAVASRLSSIGRAFAAGRIAPAARSGAASELDEGRALDAFPFSAWTSAERAMAPPLVVRVGGADLTAGALAPFLDGRQQIVLIVHGPCAPAPLVRLITPGVLVMQQHDVAQLTLLAGWRGAAIAAVMPASAVRFVHDPSAGEESWRRLSVEVAPDGPLSRIGGLSAAQQKEELRQLQTLALRPEMPVVARAPGVEPAPDPADHLASWLLQQAGLT